MYSSNRPNDKTLSFCPNRSILKKLGGDATHRAPPPYAYDYNSRVESLYKRNELRHDAGYLPRHNKSPVLPNVHKKHGLGEILIPSKVCQL